MLTPVEHLKGQALGHPLLVFLHFTTPLPLYVFSCGVKSHFSHLTSALGKEPPFPGFSWRVFNS